MVGLHLGFFCSFKIFVEFGVNSSRIRILAEERVLQAAVLQKRAFPLSGTHGSYASGCQGDHAFNRRR